MLYQKRQAEAAEKVSKLLSFPVPDGFDLIAGEEGTFNPWSLFPCVYGTYSSEFDDLALEVLMELRDQKFIRSDLASEIFREMLCVAYLCEYGISPRACFATSYFKPLLPKLIEKWDAYANQNWHGYE